MPNFNILPQIENVVVVMMENRSLDNLLGWLYPPGGAIQPKRFIPGSDTSPYDGLEEGRYFNPYGNPPVNYPVVKGTGSDGFTVPYYDPNEDFPNVMAQMFGDAANQPKTPPANGTIPGMLGFLANYEAWYERWNQMLQIMETYDPNLAPVINGLARQGAVSDRWYSSLPSQTNPNRSFSLCGTSLGRTSNLHISAIEQFNCKTIWNALRDDRPGEEPVDWAIYYHDIWQDNQCYTQYTWPGINTAKGENDVISEMGKTGRTPGEASGFYQRAMAGTLPAFTYIEPKWGYGPYFNGPYFKQGNDYHPPTDIRPAEQLLSDITMALKYNKTAWQKTLFIITFDEHGGTYDHHPPPWGAIDPKVPGSVTSDFDWNLYGVRVPVIMLSPFITPGTVFRSEGMHPYDHTSLIATILKWKGIDPARAEMGDRVAHAPTFENVLNDTIFEGHDDLPNPKPLEGGPTINSPSPLDEIIAGLSTATARCLTENSGSIEELKTNVKIFKETGGYPQKKLRKKNS